MKKLKAMINNYRTIAESCSGALSLSVLHSLVLMVLLRKINSNTLLGGDLTFMWFAVGLTALGFILTLLSIAFTIEEHSTSMGYKWCMYFLYYPVLFGVIFSGVITAGIKLKF